MALPILLAAAARFAPTALRAFGIGGGGGGGMGGRRRRRRRRLTQTDLAELTQIKMVLGKSAAAAAMPFYLGRR